MIRALIIINSSNLSQAVEMLKMPPFSYSNEEAERIFVPAGSANGEYPATKHWLSGEISENFWQACQQLCAVYDWAKCYSYDLESEPSFPFEKLKEFRIQAIKLSL